MKPGIYIKDLRSRPGVSISRDSKGTLIYPGCPKAQFWVLGTRIATDSLNRQVVRIVFFNGKTTDETAEVLKISKQTVSEYKQSALARLKKILSEDPDIWSSYVEAVC